MIRVNLLPREDKVQRKAMDMKDRRALNVQADLCQRH